MQHGDINPFLARIRNALLKCATSGGELLGFGALKGVDRHGSQVGVEAFASCPLTIHPMPPWSTLCVHNLQRILDTPCHACNAACGLNFFHPCPLLWADAAGRRLDLDAGEHRHLLAHHLRGDRDGAIAD
jgi:hypothetical protein